MQQVFKFIFGFTVMTGLVAVFTVVLPVGLGWILALVVPFSLFQASMYILVALFGTWGLFNLVEIKNHMDELSGLVSDAAESLEEKSDDELGVIDVLSEHARPQVVQQRSKSQHRTSRKPKRKS